MLKRRAFVRRMAAAALACSLLDLERRASADPLGQLEAWTYESYVLRHLVAFQEARNAARHAWLARIKADLRGDA